MASQWSSDLFVYSNAEGQEFISAALPAGIVIPATALKRYRASGPYMPISWPAPTEVSDASMWMAEKQKEGFAFVPVEV